ncbi:MAG: tRNA (adenosine(37)-N6)-threonylcarbamoyltransferase complex dimerization subunit type 1 TsaB [Parachlamydiales bacterium]|nr:tRNA (adenosine(37)-N6)-threonylcarbamoyltransferase complex dimerization subunit type 1 TsaB [Parachlamydiales bacterium]
MTTLLIDTSTERSIVAWESDSKSKYIKELPYGLQSSSHLLPLIEEGRQFLGLEYSQIKKIGVGIGPGSYTGIRVGVAIAKGFAFANSIPLVGLCSLLGFVPYECGSYAAMIDARIGGVYVQIGNKTQDLVQVQTPCLMTVEQAENIAKTVDFVITPSKLALEKRFQAQFIERSPDAQYLMDILLKTAPTAEWNDKKSLPLLYLRDWAAQ